MNETEQVELGKSGVRVSPLGLGTWSWGDGLYWGYGKGYGKEDVRAAFDASLAAGIDFLDTAEIYGFGASERLIGEFRRDNPLGKSIHLATKFFPLPWRFTTRQLLSALRGSLKRLGVEQVDLYQIHLQTPLVSVEARMDALAEAVRQGLTRAVGVSNYNAAEVRRAHARLAKYGIPLASNQIQYNLLERAPDTDGTIAACRELGVTIIAYSPIKYGMLSGKYTPTHLPTGGRARQFDAAYLAGIQPLLALLREVGEKSGKTPAQVAIRWVIQRDAIPIPGAKNLKQAQENAAALGWQIDADDMARLTEQSEQLARALSSR